MSKKTCFLRLFQIFFNLGAILAHQTSNVVQNQQLHTQNVLLAQGSVLVLLVLNSMFISGLVDTLVTHANKEGFGLTPLFGDCRGYKPPLLQTKQKTHVILLTTLWNFALVSKQPYFHFNGCYVNGERLLMHIWTVVRFSYRNFFASPKKSP